MADVSNSDDTIDSRDIDERIDELKDSLHPWRAKLCDFAGIDQDETFATHEEARDALAEWLADHAEFHAPAHHREPLENAAEQVENMADDETTEFGVGETGLTATIEAVELDQDDAEELRALEALKSELEGYCDWAHGSTLIRESYFTDYCEELLKDIGDLPKDLPGYLVIDWDKTANNLRVDYTEGEFDGVTYLVR